MEALQFLFDTFLVNPMLNVIVVLYSILFSNFGLAIIVFTILVRLVTLRLQLRQTRMMKSMQAIQPRMKTIQQIKDRSKRSQETMKLYRDEGVNPLGCLGPMVVLMLILIALYRVILKALGTSPDDLIGLSQRLYSFNPVADTVVPINSSFLWMDLANPDPSPLVLPLLVGISTWAQQKMTTPPTVDEKQASQQKMMLWMMPVMLGFFALSFPSGLALYWTVSNVIGVLIQGVVTKDWTPLKPNFARPAPAPAPAAAPEPAVEPETKEIEGDGDGRETNVRKNRRRSNRGGPERTRRRSGRGRGGNLKPR